MPTFRSIGGQEPSTITFSIDAVQLARNGSNVLREIIVVGDPDTTNANAAVLAATPASTAWGLVTRPVFSSTAADQPVRAILSSTTADNPVTATQTGTWNIATVTAVTSISSLSTGHVTVDTGNVRVVQSSATKLLMTAVISNQSSVAPSSGTSGVVVRPVIDAIVTVASTDAFSASTSFSLVTSNAAYRAYVTAYSILTTNAGPQRVSFYDSNTLLWPMVFATPTSGISGANLAASAPAYLFRSGLANALTLRCGGSTVIGWRVAVAYFLAP